MGRVVHFELNAEDAGRAVEFYRAVFGWEINKWEGGPDYYLVTTGPESEVGINGAIVPAPGQGPKTVNTIEVTSLEESLAKIKEAGGQVLSSEVQEIPGVGRFSYCVDTEGNQFGVMESSQQ